MNLHEYQAKQLFAKYGLPVPKGCVVRSVEEALEAAKTLGGNRWVVKAQVHAGGRGKAGGVRLVEGLEALQEAVRALMHTRLVTYQTDAKGQPIDQLWIEVTSDIDRELYLGAVVNRARSNTPAGRDQSRRITIMASTEGGVDIEQVAHNTPEKILTMGVNPLYGVMPYQCRDIAFKLGLNDAQMKTFQKIAIGLGRLFMETDLALVEINPLIITKAGELLCLDGKVVVDDNGLYRQPAMRDAWDRNQVDPREIIAKEWELNYVPLEGNIGCMVNGAGLAMATMDLIKLHGGKPANFLDVGGGATQERVREAFKIILSDKSVKAVLVNIFGGIVRCDDIAEGIIKAVAEVGITIPVIVRLEGNRKDEAAAVLAKSGLNIISASGLTDAAQKAVRAAGETA